jgi:DNA-binding SARP family transcriptional activator
MARTGASEEELDTGEGIHMLVRVLGSVGLDGGVELGALRLRAVLAALALHHPAGVSAERLVDVVWGDAPPVSGVEVVHCYVYRLRKALSPHAAIVKTPVGYRLELQTAELDVVLVSDLAARARQVASQGAWSVAGELLGAALALWGGEPLAGLSGDYFTGQRVRLAAWRDELVIEQVDVALRCGRQREVVSELGMLVREQPLREDLRAKLITALAQVGREADALLAYEDARCVIAEHLGVDPGSELRNLHARLLAGDTGLAVDCACTHTPTRHPVG